MGIVTNTEFKEYEVDILAMNMYKYIVYLKTYYLSIQSHDKFMLIFKFTQYWYLVLETLYQTMTNRVCVYTKQEVSLIIESLSLLYALISLF